MGETLRDRLGSTAALRDGHRAGRLGLGWQWQPQLPIDLPCGFWRDVESLTCTEQAAPSRSTGCAAPSRLPYGNKFRGLVARGDGRHWFSWVLVRTSWLPFYCSSLLCVVRPWPLAAFVLKTLISKARYSSLRVVLNAFGSFLLQ